MGDITIAIIIGLFFGLLSNSIIGCTFDTDIYLELPGDLLADNLESSDNMCDTICETMDIYKCTKSNEDCYQSCKARIKNNQNLIDCILSAKQCADIAKCTE